jgi:hypothetical protein
MTSYLDPYHHLPRTQKAKLILTGVKEEARDVIMGYADKEVNTTKKILKVCLTSMSTGCLISLFIFFQSGMKNLNERKYNLIL